MKKWKKYFLPICEIKKEKIHTVIPSENDVSPLSIGVKATFPNRVKQVTALLKLIKK